ncbi:tol-pal system protein YbgF [Thiohalorhabdus methylotrophus]|uniref:Cell division coordinator CpoB n=1 Tax=Thiohalorhabdus methylotrophus TaxID=3242694 RepID=A0ABV4TVV5_9GAMM
MPRHLGLAVGALLLLSGCLPPPGVRNAERGPDPGEVDKLKDRVESLQKALGQQGQKLAKLRQAMASKDQSETDPPELTERLGLMKERVHELGGRTEVNGHELDRLSRQLEKQLTQIRAELEQLDNRIVALEEKSYAMAGDPAEENNMGAMKAPQKGGGSSDATDESAKPEDRPADERAYRDAFQSLRAGDYEKSIEGFQKFLGNHPESEYADNAQYWLGEAFYVRGKYERALEAFQGVGQRFPESDKGPAALLKKGYAYYELQDYRNARKTLLKVVEEYPDHRVAGLAQQRLERIRKEQF